MSINPRLKGVSSLAALTLVVGAFVSIPLAAFATDDPTSDTPVAVDVIVDDASAVSEEAAVDETAPTEEAPASDPAAKVEEEVTDLVTPTEEVATEDAEEPAADQAVSALRIAPVAAAVVPAPVTPGDGVHNVSSTTIYKDALAGWVPLNRPYAGDPNGRATADWQNDGIHITNAINDSQFKITYPINKPLSEIDSLDFGVTGNGTYQLEATGWADGGSGTLVWETNYNAGLGVFDGHWWRTGTTVGVPTGANNNAEPYASRFEVTLPEILAANPNLFIANYGVNYGTYQVGTTVADWIEFDGLTTYFRPKAPYTCPAVTDVTVDETNFDTIFTYRDPENATDPTSGNANNVSYEFTDNGVRFIVDAASRERWLTNVSPLSFEQLLCSLDLSATGAGPTAQVSTDLDNDTGIDGGMYPVGPLGDEWAANPTLKAWINAHGGVAPIGGVYEAYHGTPAEWTALYPDLKFYQVGFGEGRGGDYDSVIKSLTIGSVKYTFTRTAQPADVVTPTTVTNFDCSTNTANETTTTSTVSYAWSGASTGNGAAFVRNNSWVAQPAVVVVGPAVPRPMTGAEKLANCPTPPDADAKLVCTATGAELIIDGNVYAKGTAVFETLINGKSVDTQTVHTYAYTDKLAGFSNGTTIQVDVVADGKTIYSKSLVINCATTTPSTPGGTQLDNLLAYTGGTPVPLVPVGGVALLMIFLGFIAVRSIKSGPAASGSTKN